MAVLGYERRYYFFVFAHTPQKGDNIHQANVLRILHFFRSVLSSDSRERHFLVHSRRPRLEKRLVDGLLPKQPRF